MEALVEEYLRLGPLSTRMRTHQRYSEHADDLELRIITTAGIEPGHTLLDVGCGTGAFLARLRKEDHRARLAAIDMSPAAVTAAWEAGFPAVLGDACRLPFAAGVFDFVTARHMLYHVDDPTAAVRSARRVLASGGRFVAVVNHPNSTPHIASLVCDQAKKHGFIPPALPNDLVNSANIEDLVADVFDSVRVIRSDNALVMPDARPVIEYGLAIMNFYGVSDDSPGRDAVAAGIVDEVNSWFAGTDQAWRDPKGYTICIAEQVSR